MKADQGASTKAATPQEKRRSGRLAFSLNSNRLSCFAYFCRAVPVALYVLFLGVSSTMNKIGARLGELERALISQAQLAPYESGV